MSQKNKVYGLILPKKQAQVKSQGRVISNVFNNDSDEEGEASSGPVAPYKVATSSNKMKRQTQMDIDKALQEDPSIYEYDEVYDQMQASKPHVGFVERDKTKADRKPKYITGLLKAAEVKKKEEERRLERKVQKEREAEGEMYADKEKFVTSAYKQKMLEMQEEEEKERREAAFEAMTDVTKQKDMSGFYRYLYRQSDRPGELTDGAGKTTTDSSRSGQQRRSPNSVRASSGSHGQRQRHDSSSSSESEPEPVSRKPLSRSGSSSADSRDSEGEQPQASGKGRHDSMGVHRSVSRNMRNERSRECRETRGKRESRSPSDKQLRSRERSRSPLRKQDGQRERSGSSQRFEKKIDKSSSPQARQRGEKERSRSPKARQRREKEKSSSPQARQRREKEKSRSPQARQRREKERSRSPQARQRREREKSRSPQEDISMSGRLSESAHRENDESRKRSRSPQGRQASKLSKPADVNGAGPRSSLTGKVAKPVDPAKKVYPHHNSPKDIVEARKRYLQRKLAREKGHHG